MFEALVDVVGLLMNFGVSKVFGDEMIIGDTDGLSVEELIGGLLFD